MLRTFFFAAFLLSIAGVASAQSSLSNPLADLDKMKDFESRRSSSCDPNWKNGNGDNRYIAPGGTLTIGELEGPGSIAHIWLTINHPAKYYSRLLTIRIYWDGEEHPSVECPLGDFFGIGHGVDHPLNSMPIRVTATGRGRNCYWPMPFRKSAKITITNESTLPCNGIYYYVDWQKHPSLPDNTLYFHATYRQEFPCVMGQNFLVADIEGRGHYVGTVQSVVNISTQWFGEGDDFFFIDGDKEPTLRGTGTEDYFCDGWGFWSHPDGLYYGAPMPDNGHPGALTSVYRFHIPDPITFKKSFRLEIEHKGAQDFPDKTSNWFIERDDLMSSVAFWYQTEPHKPWAALPPGPERLPFREKVMFSGSKAGAEVKHSESKLEQQSLPNAKDKKQLVFELKEKAAWLEIPFKVEDESFGNLYLRARQGEEFGKYRVLLDGKEIDTFDFYDGRADITEKKLGWRELAAGDHVLRFECVGRHDSAKGCSLGIDAVTLESPVYFRNPKVDLRTLQKK
jgi:hypothetical protein